MDFSYEFLVFQRGNHDMNEKNEFYQNFIMSLLEELKTLRETMCRSCQKTGASSKATRSGNPSFAISKDSTIAMRLPKLRHVIPTLPRMPKMNALWRTRAPGSRSLPINETMASESSSQSTEQRNETDNPIFSAVRGSLADSTIDVTFVHSFRLKAHVYYVCFSPDGRYLAVSTGSDDKDGSIFIYEMETHKKYCELREYASQYGSYTRPRPWDLCFSTDGRYLAVVDLFRRMIIWDVPHKRIRSIFHGGEGLSQVRFSPDGRLIAFCNEKGLIVLNMRDNSRRMASKGSCFEFNPSGRYIATGNQNGVLVMLDVRTGKAVNKWNANGTYLSCVKFTADGKGLSCVYNNMVEQWDVSDAEPVLIREFDCQTNLTRTVISQDHRLLAYSDKLWDVNSGKCQYTLQGHNGIISSVGFSAPGTYLAMGSWDGFVSLWRYDWE